MIWRVKHKKLNIIWPISILRFLLPFISYTFFGNIFLSLSTVFDCDNGNNMVSPYLECRSGLWFKIFGPLSFFALICECIIGIITSILYFKPIFNKGSDILKKSNSIPETGFILTKICVNTLFILINEDEENQPIALFFVILFTGLNAYLSLKFQNKPNKILSLLNNILSFLLFASFVSLAMGKMLSKLQTTGLIYFYFSSIIIIFLFFLFYKNREINFIAIDSSEINNPKDYLDYIYRFYEIIHNQKSSRNCYTILESLLYKIEENCIYLNCPLKKYIYHLEYGIEYPFLLNQYCEKLFEYGISKFSGDISLNISYSNFLITDMNDKNKALMILNSIKKSVSFIDNYYLFRALRLIKKWNFYSEGKDEDSYYQFRNKEQEFKSLIKRIINLYYDFFSLLLESNSKKNDSFNKIHEIGREIMKNNPKIEKIYNELLNEQTNKNEIIKLYSDYVETVLYDEEKLEQFKNIPKLNYSSSFELHEKDYSNFNLEIMNDKGNLSYMIISTYKEQFGKILDLSLNTLKIFGYLKSEIIGENINILIPKIFQKAHTPMIQNYYEKHKIKLFDDLNKRIIYYPEIFKKEIYGISKMKFLIELMANIYFVKTEENKLVYLIEITNYTPLTFDLTKNNSNISNYCVLTDENFLIQTFTSNCLEFLNLDYTYINSNNSIIHYIKQFQDDYIIALNSTGISKHSNINKSEFFQEDEQKTLKRNISPTMKKKIRNDLFTKKYSKKCKITWKVDKDINNINNLKNPEGISSMNNNGENSQYIRSNIFRQLDKEDNKDVLVQQKNIYMDIKKAIINNVFLGYYFYFSNIKSKHYNNISYTLENNETKNNYLPKLKKYKCKFKIKDEDLLDYSNEINTSNAFNTLIIKPSKEEDIKQDKEINKNRKKIKKGTLEQKVNFQQIDKNQGEDFNLIELFKEESEITLSDDFIPKYESHFTIDLTNLSFIQVNAKEKKFEYLDILKNEAQNKIKIYQEKLKLLSKDSESSNYETEELESDEDSEDNNSESLDIKSDLDENIKIENNKMNNSIKKEIIIKEKEENNQLKFGKKNDILNNSNENNITQNLSLGSKKLQKKTSLMYNFYKVNLNNMHYMIFDFYRDMIIEGNKKEICSKIEHILTNEKKLGPIDLAKDERFSFFSSFNKTRKNQKNNKSANNNDNYNNNINNNIMNEEKLYRKKIFEKLNHLDDEPPIKKLKISILISFVILISYGIICLILDLLYLSYLNNTLNIIKHTSFIRYYTQFSVYYLRELTIINFEFEGLRGSKYTEFVGKEKEEYISLIKDKLMELFIENQKSLQVLFSISLSLSDASSKTLKEYRLKLRVSNSPLMEMNYDILTSFMQYSSAFYSLASSTSAITQKNSDIFNFIYNNLNGYKDGLNVLLLVFDKELKKYYRHIKTIVISGCFLVVVFSFSIIVIVIKLFLKAIETRGNYMKVFNGINEKVLRYLIVNCENLMKKMKTSEDRKYYEEESVNESIEEKINIDENIKNKKKSISNNSMLNYGIENKSNNKASNTGFIFVVTFIIFNLIIYSYVVYNGFYMLYASQRTIDINNCNTKMQNHHLTIIEYFNAYREFLYDNGTIIDGTNVLNYLNNFWKKNIINMMDDMIYVTLNLRKLIEKKGGLAKTLCNFYINDYYESSNECENQIGLITTKGFGELTFYFIEEIKLGKNVLEYKLQNENILGNLTEYNFNDYNDLIKIIGSDRQNNDDPYNSDEFSDESGEDFNADKNTFRLALFNDETLHKNINIIFFSIILPYIDTNFKVIYNTLNIDGIDNYLSFINYLFYILTGIVYLFFFFPLISYINTNIYKTKNMLSIIPLNILSNQNGVSELLRINKSEKK